MDRSYGHFDLLKKQTNKQNKTKQNKTTAMSAVHVTVETSCACHQPDVVCRSDRVVRFVVPADDDDDIDFYRLSDCGRPTRASVRKPSGSVRPPPSWPSATAMVTSPAPSATPSACTTVPSWSALSTNTAKGRVCVLPVLCALYGQLEV